MNSSIEKETAILVVSCDSYSDIWHPFFYCFFKYWPDCPFPVYLGSNYLTYPDARVKSILVGKDTDYSSNLLAMLDTISYKWIILWIEDRLVSAPVNTANIINLISYIETKDGGYLKLLSHLPFAPQGEKRDKISELPKGISYRISITTALWKKSVLRNLLHKGESAWQIERQGSLRSNNINTKFFALTSYGSLYPPISDMHLIIKGHMTTEGRKFLLKEGLQKCRAMNRRSENFRTYIYVRLYLIGWDLFNLFKYRDLPFWRIPRLFGKFIDKNNKM